MVYLYELVFGDMEWIGWSDLSLFHNYFQHICGTNTSIGQTTIPSDCGGNSHSTQKVQP